MNHIEIASRAGVTLGDLRDLEMGQISYGLALRLGVTSGALQDFIEGRANMAIPGLLGLSTMAAAEDIASSLGRQGAIGVLLGLLLARR